MTIRTFNFTNLEGQPMAVVSDHLKAIRVSARTAITLTSGESLYIKEGASDVKRQILINDEREWFRFLISDTNNEMYVRRSLVERLEGRKEGAGSLVGFTEPLFHMLSCHSPETMKSLMASLES